MSGWFRVTVVKAKNQETVRTIDFEVPQHPHPIALGVGPHGGAPPDAVREAAVALLKRGEALAQIVHLSEGPPA